MILFVTITIIVGVQSQLTKEIPYNAVVSTDGIGNFNTTSGAILATPDHNVKPLFINLKNGTYQKYIRVDETKTTIILIREGMNTMIITDNRSFVDGNRTYDTAIVGVAGNGFIAQNITFRNNVRPIKHQAVTLRVDADLVSFYECHFDGYQDTLYVKRQIQSYCDCEIYRTIDFICGDATAVFQNYLIEACTPMARQYNTIIEKHQELELFASGILFQNCTIKATHDLEKSVNVTTYLGRPWGLFSRTVIMESYIDRLIDPRGWVDRRPYYLEYKNRGSGAAMKGCVTWAFVTTDPNIALNFTVRNFISGDQWIPVNIPHYLDLS
uniref:Pectinesterase catalytic domain-containing protein n=1 Tax=Solanum lycopersicum TaxID=4081 RepID=A0A3Q7IX47_SOLLC